MPESLYCPICGTELVICEGCEDIAIRCRTCGNHLSHDVLVETLRDDMEQSIVDDEWGV